MNSDRLLLKPLVGGPFGHDGRFAVGTRPVVAKGLHALQFMVVAQREGIVVAIGETQSQVLADARRVIAAAGELAAANDPVVPHQWALWTDEELPASAPAIPATAPVVSRRRREVWDLSRGACRYCGVQLELAGDWHVDHVLSRSLGGGDSIINLAAACPACNLRKGSKSGLEFVSGWEPFRKGTHV